MAFWHRIRNPNLKILCIQFQRCYIHLLHASTPKRFPVDIPHPNSVFRARPTSVFNTIRFFAAPVQYQVKHKNEEEEDDDSSAVRLNEEIKAPYVRLVVNDNEHSIVPRYEALKRAKMLKLDLVMVDRIAKPPVVKIMDFRKHMYKRKEWEKERAKSRAEMTLRKDIKELRFSEKTEAKDLKNKADMIRRLTEKGYRVKCKVSGKENQDMTVLFSPLIALIEDVCIVESGPQMGKKDAFMIVRHIKFGPSKKGVKKLQNATNVETQEEGDMEASTGYCSDSIENESHAEFGSVFGDNVNMTASPNNETNTAPEASRMSENRYRRTNETSTASEASPMSENRYRRTIETNTAPEASPMSENRYRRTNQTNTAPEVSPMSENRYRRTNHHGENNVPSNAQMPPAVTENRYKRVDPRNRFQQTSNNPGVNYQGPGTRDAFRPPPSNWNRPMEAPVNVNVNPRMENNRQAFTHPGSRHSMPSHENIHSPPPNAPNTPRSGYGNFSGSNEGIPIPPGAPKTHRSSSYGNFSGLNEGIPRHPSAPNTPRSSS